MPGVQKARLRVHCDISNRVSRIFEVILLMPFVYRKLLQSPDAH